MIPLRDRNPSDTVPVVTIGIIAACTIAFLYEASLGRGVSTLLASFALVPAQVTYDLRYGGASLSGTFLPFLTSMFLHGGWLHLIGNMWFLWIFGDNVEDALGSVRYLLFYLVCGFAAGATQYMLAPQSTLPTIGASGAIAGVLGGYALLYPRARVLTLVPLGFFLQVIELPAVAVLVLWFGIQAVSGILSLGMNAGGVAWWAHVGGFIAGLLLILPFRRRSVLV
jgi:membrane associated rhomboid family serine protease